MVCFRILAAFLWLQPTTSLQDAHGASTVILLTVDDAIHPACADYILSGIERASEADAACVVIKLNTPGGLLKSTRVIVTELLESPVPVIVYVSPPGSQSASAGVFITLAAHIAAMAPGTNIGAAHPVSLMGVQDSVMMEKATNDAAAFIRSISEKRHRNVQWAEDAVRKSLSITEREALEEHVIDLIAENMDSLLVKVDGRMVETSQGNVVLATAGAVVIEHTKTLAQRLLSILSDPNLAYILLMFGIYGLFFELYSPGAIFPGVVGGICIILAFYAMHSLPINYAGLALIVFAVILFILEVKVVSHGLLTIGGVVSLFLGSVMLIDRQSFLDAMHISLELIILLVALTAAFFLLAITFAIRAHRKKVTTGNKGIVGEKGVAISSLRPEGDIRVHGEIWHAESVGGPIAKGSAVVITDIEQLKLKVKKAN
jgi:membrane-bound serine protease (ClpP class)